MVHDGDWVSIEHDRRGAHNYLEEVAGVSYLEHCASDASIAYLEEGEGFLGVAAPLWQAESPQESLGQADAECGEEAVAVAAQESRLWDERWALYAHRVHPVMRCIGCRERLHVAPLTGTKCAMDDPMSVQTWRSNGVLLEPYALNSNRGHHPASKKDPYAAAMAAKQETYAGRLHIAPRGMLDLPTVPCVFRVGAQGPTPRPVRDSIHALLFMGLPPQEPA